MALIFHVAFPELPTDINRKGFHQPFFPKSDQYLIPPYSITAKSNNKVMRMKEKITN